MTDYAEAVKNWKASQEFERSSDPTTLKAPADQREYLVNRLEAAFVEGVAAGQKIAEKRIAKALHREIPR